METIAVGPEPTERRTIMSCLLGIDLGTSGLKAILANDSGRILANAYRAYSFDSPSPGYAEQDPEVWWRACREALSSVLTESAVDPAEIRGISFSGQMHGLVALDEHGNVVRPAILHCDARSSAEIDEIRAAFSESERSEFFMNPIFTGFLMVSLLWVRKNEPENYARIRKVCLPKDYLRYKLTGIVSSDYSDASATLAFDIPNRSWSSAILDRLSLPRELFPDCDETIAPVAPVSRTAALETGLSETTVVVAGGGDQVMQSIGNGLISDGDGSVNIGSSGQVSFQLGKPFLNPALNSNMFCAYDRDRWIMFGATMSAGLSLKWWNRIIQQSSYEELNHEIGKIQPGSGGLLFFPYLNGERTPHVNPNISGTLMGFNHTTSRFAIARAVMEGVAFSLKDCLDICMGAGFLPNRLVASGGGARSPQWLQIQADILGLPLVVSRSEEQAGMGAVIVAGTGSGVFHDIREAIGVFVRYQDQTIEPGSDARRIYTELHEIYKDAYRRMAPALETLTVFGRRQEARAFVN